MFNLIFKSSTSLTFEMDNKDIVVTNPFNVYVNETLVLNDFKNNVFSIYDLAPNLLTSKHTYSYSVVTVNVSSLSFCTTLISYLVLGTKSYIEKTLFLKSFKTNVSLT